MGISLIAVSQICSASVNKTIPKDSPTIEAEKQLAVEWKLEKKITDNEFLKAFENENKARKQMLKEGQVIYGPQQYTLEQYYAYTNRTRTRKLCNEVIQRGLIKAEDISSYYEKNKEKDYRMSDTIKLKIREFDSKEKTNTVSSTLEINPENIRYYAKVKPELLKIVQSLKQQEKMEIVNDTGKIYEIECQERRQNGYIGKSELYDNIQERLAQEYLKSLLSEIIERGEKNQ